MQELEIAIKASSRGDAVKLLNEMGISDDNKSTYRDIDGLFIVSVTKTTPLSEIEYRHIKQSTDLAILADSLSRQRVSEILDKIYDAETQLRKLLLHVSDLVEVYYDVFSKSSKYAKDFASNKSITRAGSLNPITSHLTLGEMMIILGTDLSWSKRSLTLEDLTDALDSSTDFDSLKNYLTTKATPSTIWDIIAKNVLHSTKTWRDIEGDLSTLKRFRDLSAHYQVVTKAETEELLTKAQTIMPAITPKPRDLTKEEQSTLSTASTLSKRFADALLYDFTIGKEIAAITSLTPAISTIVKPALDIKSTFSSIVPDLTSLSTTTIDAIAPTFISLDSKRPTLDP